MKISSYNFDKMLAFCGLLNIHSFSIDYSSLANVHKLQIVELLKLLHLCSNLRLLNLGIAVF